MKQIPGELVKIQAKNQLPKNCDISDAKEAQKRKQSETGGLAYSLKLKINDGNDDDDDDELFCGMVDRRKAFSLISSRDHCQRSSPSRAGFEPAQNLSSGLVE